MKQQQRRAQISLCMCFFLLMLGGSICSVKGADLAEKCSQVVQKVAPCLEFATGKAASPTKGCCDSASEIKESNPECLCYIIQQTHKGSTQVKNLGIQEAKLLQLPTACNLKNASLTNCPKLLGLSPNSPDAAIFMNASSAIAPAETATSPAQNGSYGSMLRPSLMADVMVVALAILLVVIPTRFVSIYL